MRINCEIAKNVGTKMKLEAGECRQSRMEALEIWPSHAGLVLCEGEETQYYRPSEVFFQLAHRISISPESSVWWRLRVRGDLYSFPFISRVLLSCSLG